MVSNKSFNIPREVLADMTKGNLQAIRAFENIQANANRPLDDEAIEAIIVEVTERVLAVISPTP